MINIGFDLLTLTAFINENSEFLLGARLQKIQQPTRQEFILGLRNNSESRKLYISTQPNLYHICFMSTENEDKRLIRIPSFPPMFCMLLRKHLENKRIVKIEQPENERILELYFKSYIDEEPVLLCLAIELMGKYSNVILYNYDTNVIIGCAHNVGEEKSRERVMAGTLPYTYPQKQLKKPFPLTVGEFVAEISKTENIAEALVRNYYGISQAFAELICSKEKNLSKLYEKLRDCLDLKGLTPAVSDDFSEYCLFADLIASPVLQKSVNEMIDNYYAEFQNREKIATLKNNLLSPILAKYKKVQNSVENFDKQINSVEKADEYRKKGDLLMANLYSNKDFVPYVEVYDYKTDSTIEIELDSSKTLKENANRFYKLYNKAKTSAGVSQELMNELLQEQNYLEQVIYSIENASKIDEFEQIEEELGLTKNKPKSYQKKKTIEIEQRKIGGFIVYIGKNNKQNDHIVSKVAADEDYWFHTRLCAGSHVLLKSEAGKEPNDKTLFECAKLAKEHSKGKDSSKVAVIYTKRKFIKKPPAAKLGYVIYKNEKEIIVD